MRSCATKLDDGASQGLLTGIQERQTPVNQLLTPQVESARKAKSDSLMTVQFRFSQI